jgi:multimeric flavodoxin WrbA
MAEAVAEGVRQAGAEAVIRRVPELVPEEVARMSNFKLDQKAPIATVGPTTTRSSSACRHASATWRRR